jgi:orotate phosphoribosyltransferase
LAASIIMADKLQGCHPDETLRVLRETNAILQDDHFVYVSGDHGSGWIDKDAIYPHTERVEQLGRLLGRACKAHPIEVVCGPATGGLILAEWIAHELGILATFTEHDPTPAAGSSRGRFVLRRGYDHVVAGRRVLVVDDIVNTGLSILQTIDAVRAAGGDVLAAGTLVDRGNVDPAAWGIREYVYLLQYRIPAWPAAKCPLCQGGVPVNSRYAHGAEFVAAQSRPE